MRQDCREPMEIRQEYGEPRVRRRECRRPTNHRVFRDLVMEVSSRTVFGRKMGSSYLLVVVHQCLNR